MHGHSVCEIETESVCCPYQLAQGPAKENTTHFPFGFGARRCPGEGVAVLEAKMLVANMCKYFDVLPADFALPVEEEFSITMLPKNLKLIIRSK